jgi:thioredoxin 1
MDFLQPAIAMNGAQRILFKNSAIFLTARRHSLYYPCILKENSSLQRTKHTLSGHLIMQKYIIFSILLFFVTACSSDEQPDTQASSVKTETQTSVSAATPSATRDLASHKMIFFLDPNGGPCRLQVSILNEMASELRGKIDIQYVQTTVPSDRDIFYKYGIRALPTLLLADTGGKEIKRMTPGVKQPDDIRNLLQSIPKS